MKTIINNGQVLNVHTSQYEKKNIVIEADKITDLSDSPVTGKKGDVVIDATGKYIIPGLIANAMAKQGITRTLTVMFVAAVVVRLLINIIFGGIIISIM